MPTQSKAYLLPNETIDQITDICDEIGRRTGIRPSEPQTIVKAVFDLHAAVCQATDTTPIKPSKAARARENRQARSEAMRSIGMRKVRGNLGGTYWE